MTKKLKVATCSLAGCFGCHMSLLDIDEDLVDLQKHIEFNRSPLTDIKTLGECDVGLVEGGLCNEDNREVLLEFRKKCRILVSVGACAINGGVPALRNQFSTEECLEEVYQQGFNTTTTLIPSDPEIPQLLSKVTPNHESVDVDYFLPGCPPPAAAFSEFLTALIENKPIHLDYPYRRFD
ncbi:NAD-reducing hydrogenase HoxS subunit delta [BD1-7 clade bacterium]|uniref:NAD-reducing hydrogenase HoxS subunit delta n=1 Tax=BD1-7 clade bacterium TaxID=2029982 RepID=A0A5S9QM14_9GAMM|nr:NAD-reducing hydrogenase HoxS subunit delta [BD1-7 clade bacterium]